MAECGCRVTILIRGEVIGTLGIVTEGEPPYIVYCPTHAAAFRLADALEGEWEMNHAEMCTNRPHRPGDACHYPRPAILREIGRG